ncbi:hypothetical protein GCM10010415_65960 [Streptomyces atrovirens]
MALVSQGLRNRRSDRHVRRPGRQLVPDEPVSDFGKETHRQQEADTDTGRQIMQSTLETTGLVKDSVDQFERYDGRQLAQMTGR